MTLFSHSVSAASVFKYGHILSSREKKCMLYKFLSVGVHGVSGSTYQLIIPINYFENYNTEIFSVLLLLNIYVF